MSAHFVLKEPALAFTRLACSKGAFSVVYFVALNECLIDDRLQWLSCLVSIHFVLTFPQGCSSFRNKLLFLKDVFYKSPEVH